MEQKLVRVPFEVELAKKIAEKSVEGKIVTREGKDVRVVCWDKKGGKFPIIALVKEGNEDEETSHFTVHGMFYCREESAMDLILEIPEYTTFKDGDIIAYDDCDTMAIIKAEFFKNDSGDICSKSYITILDEKNLQQFSVSMNSARLATEEEKQKFVNILKESKELKAKIILKQFFGINPKQLYEFKPFDKVLVRCNDKAQWSARFFDRMFEGKYACTDALTYKQCLPYNDQTKHLLGTTDNWEE